MKKIVIDTINPISENNKIKVKTWLEWSANGIESVEKVETEVKCTFRDDNSGIDKIVSITIFFTSALSTLVFTSSYTSVG